MSRKISALVTSEIFRLLVNTLTPDDKYSRRYMQIPDKNFKGLDLKKEWLFSVFYCISEMCMEFTKFWKKRRVS